MRIHRLFIIEPKNTDGFRQPDVLDSEPDDLQYAIYVLLMPSPYVVFPTELHV